MAITWKSCVPSRSATTYPSSEVGRPRKSTADHHAARVLVLVRVHACDAKHHTGMTWADEIIGGCNVTGGVLFRRSDVLTAGGGGIAYPPKAVHQQWPAEIQVWGNPIRTDGQGVMDFRWEREWRILAPGGAVVFPSTAVAAVLVGDPNWTPTPAPPPESTAKRAGPCQVPGAIPLHHYSADWTNAVHLYWDGTNLRPIR
ncbi:hypothetical protein [Nonomuraea sp. NPDC048901]|uniref:hypothetical protein n=1 Tax=Nonomuraea sp. NPDC048901 TaxID=3155627 RepID=UPI0033F45305